jgi:hypothetical protein
MTFKEALNKAWDLEEKRLQPGQKFAPSKETVKVLIFFWNMLKASDFVLDDFAYLDKNLDVQSFPEEEKQQKPATAAKGKKKVGDDGSGTEKQS